MSVATRMLSGPGVDRYRQEAGGRMMSVATRMLSEVQVGVDPAGRPERPDDVGGDQDAQRVPGRRRSVPPDPGAAG
jgi:hypothetical protein